MLKRITLAALLLVMTTWSALAAGTIPLSGAVQVDTQGQVMPGCLLYTFQSGTSTPQSAYQDTSLTIAHPNPMSCDGAGRLPFFYLADGSIKIRLTNAAGVDQLTADGLLVVGPSSGGGGGSPVDATTVLATGDVKAKYGTGALSGFVRLNGRTIGSATSGATERANADAQALFEYLWTADSNLAVSGGRGASANADWLANKTITLPDARGRVLAALDDMGASAAGRLTATHFGAAGTTLGNVGGGESRTIAQTNLPNVNFTVTIPAGQGSHTHTGPLMDTFFAAGGGQGVVQDFVGVSASFTTNAATLPEMTGTAPSGGSGTAFAIVQPTILVTYYIKL